MVPKGWSLYLNGGRKLLNGWWGGDGESIRGLRNNLPETHKAHPFKGGLRGGRVGGGVGGRWQGCPHILF